MEKYMKDNKNHHSLTFLSLLTTRKLIFEEVQLKFLVVGHTHKDINGNFDICSKI
jgi:hypothetical protein